MRTEIHIHSYSLMKTYYKLDSLRILLQILLRPNAMKKNVGKQTNFEDPIQILKSDQNGHDRRHPNGHDRPPRPWEDEGHADVGRGEVRQLHHLGTAVLWQHCKMSQVTNLFLPCEQVFRLLTTAL